MQVKAKYEDGKLIFEKNIRLKRYWFPVRVELTNDVLAVAEKFKK